MTTQHFTKMHGAGNDFAILDCRQHPMALDAARIRAFGNRHTGVGFDQLISVQAARDPACAFDYAIWNADGSKAGQCGNGLRCVAAWLHRAGVLDLDKQVILGSPSGQVSVQLRDPLTVTAGMGEPIFEPARIPFLADAMATGYSIQLDTRTVTIGAVSMGNPHAIVQVDDVGDPSVAVLGPLLTQHPRFPEQVNAGFVQVVSRDHVRLRVHERGAGWTLACGSGACAAVAVLRQRHEVNAEVQVDLPGGSLRVTWHGAGTPLWLTGPAIFVAEGEWLLPEPAG